MVVLRQFLRLPDCRLEVAALPSLEPIRLHTEALGNRFRRVAALLARPCEKSRIHLGYGHGGSFSLSEVTRRRMAQVDEPQNRRYPAPSTRFKKHTLNLHCFAVTFALGDDPH